MTEFDLLESKLEELARVMASLRKASTYYQDRSRYAREKYGLPGVKILRSRKVRRRREARERARQSKTK